MTEIYYKIIGGHGECIGFKEGDAHAVKISVLGGEDGIVQVGTRAKRLTGGSCYLSLAPLTDGDHAPTLTVRGENIPLECIRKVGEKLTRPPISTALIARLLARAEAAEMRLGELEERLSELEGDVHGTPIFTT